MTKKVCVRGNHDTTPEWSAGTAHLHDPERIKWQRMSREARLAEMERRVRQKLSPLPDFANASQP